ncbi:conserved hypothetical protein [Alkaliphilus metalliredigens QYMF]|uniref:Uncharacterized protein n=1 Tax=Alkaliphilus metalliredigens (strain QYMF) TaxID=293826 RepID=A6TNR7_ALKMQ|nr:glucosaminidase domain-containing protein [Alkaliphilus metalliredigens]ABR47835.1 conserved hypothetical protein [Alkaliphilus metalliredigens QYMF]
MITFVDRLATKPILTRENIFSLKKYIEFKYPHHGEKHKAQILAKSIRQVIDHELKGFEVHHQEELRTRLLQKTLFEQQRSILCSDIVECCITMDSFTDDTLDTLSNWINHKIQDSIDIETIMNYREAVLSKDQKNLAESFIEEVPLVYAPFVGEVDQVIDEVTTNRESSRIFTRLSNHHLSIFILLTFVLLFIGYSINIDPSTTSEPAVRFNIDEPMSQLTSGSFTTLMDEIITFYHIPQTLRYRNINENHLRFYLIDRGSLLGRDPHFLTIIETSKKFHLDPLILFSIAGHEQGFIPESHPNAGEIINNPYNVFESWIKYNTNLEDSSAIAARTVSNLLKGLPKGMDPFKWINRRYAEDPDWWRGVRSIYEHLNKIVESN